MSGDDNLKPWNVCCGVGQGIQDVSTTLSAATLIKCVNDKGESPFWEGRKLADEAREENMLH